MLRAKLSIFPGSLLSIYVQNIAKLYCCLLKKCESEDDWDSVESVDNLMLSKLPEFQYSEHLEAQERVNITASRLYNADHAIRYHHCSRT